MGWGGGASLVLPLGCANKYPRDGVICPHPLPAQKRSRVRPRIRTATFGAKILKEKHD